MHSLPKKIAKSSKRKKVDTLIDASKIDALKVTFNLYLINLSFTTSLIFRLNVIFIVILDGVLLGYLMEL